MAILLPEGLPARRRLAREGVTLLDGNARWSGHRPPLRVALLNLMPRRAATEMQIARLLGSTPHRVELSLLVPASYRPRTADPEHLAAFYRPWTAVREQNFDGLIVTGAPVETLPFEAVDYWPELTEILDWSERAVGGSYFICWAAQAALYHRHGVPKHALAQKAFGVYPQDVRARGAALLRGFGQGFPVPVSRHTEVRAEDLPANGAVQVLADSPESGLCLLQETGRRAVYAFNHFEYDAGTLFSEYLRDRAAGLPALPPRNAVPDTDPARLPPEPWRTCAHMLFCNWLDGLAARSFSSLIPPEMPPIQRSAQRSLGSSWSWTLPRPLPNRGLAGRRAQP